MPCTKASITKTYKCDKEGCLCIPTNGAARVCLSVNEMGYIVRCDCKCDTKCECNENCTCINTAGMTCICVCRDQHGRIKTCEDCSCQPKQAQTQSCKGKSNTTCCCNTGNEKCACLDCSCCESGKNKKGGKVSCATGKAESGCESQGKSRGTCACNKSTCKPKRVDGSFKDRTRQSTNCCGNCDEKCKCSEQEDALKANVCARKICSENCKCQGNANSSACICKNKQVENVCCDDCKCDGNNRCEKKECVCVRKESSCQCKSLETRCCGRDEKCKCSDRKQDAASKAKNYTGCTCSGNSKCQGNANSCVCNEKQGENDCCDNFKCDGNNRCDKEGCICVPIESACKSEKPNCCKNCDAKCMCSCVNQKADFNAVFGARKICLGNCKCRGNGNSCVCICKNKQGEDVCCDDCKCDNNNICDKKGCVCVPKEDSSKDLPEKPNRCENCDAKCKCSCMDQEATIKAYNCARKACGNNCKCKGNVSSCVCICKNKQGESTCCDDCKCDTNNICDKKGFVCVPKEDTQPEKPTCCENCNAKCECSCVDQEAAIKAYKCAREACGNNCKCKANASSCVCICKNKQGKTTCCDDCKCDTNNICDKKGCVCVPKEESSKDQPEKPNCCVNCDPKCKCCCVDQETAIKAYNCARKFYAGNCKCRGNGNSCVCICKNKQGETTCCDDCKCDNNNICNKKGCVCVPKEDFFKGQPEKPNCCQNCDTKCKCSCVDEQAVFNANSCAEKVCSKNCKCQGNANSCVCICKNNQGETCDNCRCDSNNGCDKEGCACIPCAYATSNKQTEPKCCC